MYSIYKLVVTDCMGVLERDTFKARARTINSDDHS
jgi:hypothetical protein